MDSSPKSVSELKVHKQEDMDSSIDSMSDPGEKREDPSPPKMPVKEPAKEPAKVDPVGFSSGIGTVDVGQKRTLGGPPPPSHPRSIARDFAQPPAPAEKAPPLRVDSPEYNPRREEAVPVPVEPSDHYSSDNYDDDFEEAHQEFR